MSQTTRLALPLIEAAQSQKHVTHNEALVGLDALVQLSVRSRAMTPPAPSEGDRYLVAATASGVFANKANMIASFDNGGWAFLSPRAGWRCYVESERLVLLFDGAQWADIGLSVRTLANVDKLGVGTVADSGNPLTAKLNGALFAAKASGEGGTGDLRIALNKSAVGNTVSHVYQTNWSGRAEVGLTGDDRFRLKVSSDGAVWREALTADPASGKICAPSGRVHAATGKDFGDLLFTPGGDGQVSLYRMDRTSRAQNPRTAAVASVSGDTIALTTADADLFFNAVMFGVSYVRIWNVSKSPNVPAWVKKAPDASHLQVTNAADIVGWSAGDAIQIGDPTSATPNRVIAIDISPMLQSVLGATFLFKAILIKHSIAAAPGASAVAGVSAGGLALSATGASGSFQGANLPSDGAAETGQIIVPASALSPISNSNLIFLRETAAVANTLGVTIASSVGLFV